VIGLNKQTFTDKNNSVKVFDEDKISVGYCTVVQLPTYLEVIKNKTF
jgi:hypothetical protein